MKRIPATLLILASVTLGAWAQGLQKNESVMVYAMPKTVLQFDVTLEKVEQKVGRFYLYAQRYLQTTDVITEDKTSYVVKSISLRTRTVADEQRQFMIYPNANLATSMISIDHNGVLVSINAEPATSNNGEVKCLPLIPAQTVSCDASFDLPFFNNEQILANSVSKMAEITAKQIYRLRDSRLSWLNGDVDHMPADGESMKVILAELEKTERELCELFVGKTMRQSITTTVEYVPTASVKNHVLCRVSNAKGLVAADDLSGAPIFLHVDAQKLGQEPDNLDPSAKDSKSNSKNPPAVYYNLPGKATVRVSEGAKVHFSDQLVMPQFGMNLSLPQDLFKRGKVSVRFDTRTGALLEVTK